VLLGGRAAEVVVFGQVSTGAQNDLERASGLARRMVTQFGMSERMGPVSLEQDRKNFLWGDGFGGHKDYSEQTAREIDEEVKAVVTAGEVLALTTLREHRAVLEKIAGRLIEVELVDREELDVLLGAPPAPPALPA
jgi:cell division protease FtsH